jgi:hypothetical protein
VWLYTEDSKEFAGCGDVEAAGSSGVSIDVLATPVLRKAAAKECAGAEGGQGHSAEKMIRRFTGFGRAWRTLLAALYDAAYKLNMQGFHMR